MSLEKIEVQLPEGPVCGADGGKGASCILPVANGPTWHMVYGGHLARVVTYSDDAGEETGYVTWTGAEADPLEPEAPLPVLHPRPDIVGAE